MLDNPRELSINQFEYLLPDERIAKFPLAKRDSSKLLVYSNGQIQDKEFGNLPDLLNPGDVLIANQTRVVLARLEFKTATGARVEVFCLEPGSAYAEIQTAMLTTGSIEWRCLIGNAKKWKEKEILELTISGIDDFSLKANLRARDQDAFVVQFNWNPAELSFAEVLDKVGNLPLPPYLKREVKQEDFERYQTIYSKDKGSVAAPTAGLHFTPEVLEAIKFKGVEEVFLTLHVGAGTFMPVKSEKMAEHQMHQEEVVVALEMLKKIVGAQGRLVAVGTTTLRSLESLYWTAVRLLNTNTDTLSIDVKQWEPYENDYVELPKWREAFIYLISRMESSGMDSIRGQTSLLIAPGYKIRTADTIITNFHQPKSTLLLLVSACIGVDWKKVYQHALDNDYRFLSYGDSSILRIQK
jgi:S-adenosylmethionine:tRNA ribosyltransferase-isomerase